jgi:hypothetical protein
LDNSAAAANSFQNTNSTCNNNPLTPSAAGGRVGKNPGLKQKTQPSGFYGVFSGFLSFLFPYYMRQRLIECRFYFFLKYS